MAMTIDSVIDVFAATGAGLSKKDSPAPADEPFRDYLEQAGDNRIEERDAPSPQRAGEEARASRSRAEDATRTETATTPESDNKAVSDSGKPAKEQNDDVAAKDTRSGSGKVSDKAVAKDGAEDAEQSARPEIAALAALGLNMPQSNPATAATAATPTAEGKGRAAATPVPAAALTGEEAIPGAESEIGAKPRRAQEKGDQDPLLARLAATKGRSGGGSKSPQKVSVQDFLKQVQNNIPANDTPAAHKQNPNLPLQATPGPSQAAIAATAQQQADPAAPQGGNGSITGLSAAGGPGQTQGQHAARTIQHSPVLQQPVAQQVAVQISRAVSEGQNRFDISLHPQELGKVKVKLEIGHDGRVLATVAAERPETLAMLRRDAFALEQALQNAGLNPDGGSLQFSLSGEQAGQGFATGDEGTSHGSGSDGPIFSEAEAPETPEAPRQMIATSALDITV